MLGPFPTWFPIRERGHRYRIAIRMTWYPDGIPTDPQEVAHLAAIHNKFRDVTNSWGEATPGFIWETFGPPRLGFGPGSPPRPGIRLTYQAYTVFPVPFGWRKPFLDYLNEVVGPPGERPQNNTR